MRRYASFGVWLEAGLLSVAGVSLSQCETYLDLPDAELIEVEPTLEMAAGEACRSYCDAVMANCTGADAVYVNRVQCLNVCRTMAPGMAGEDFGNTLQCRLLNARLAGETAEPRSHCSQAGPGGAARPDLGNSCTTNCEGLCAGMRSICPEQFSSLNACLEDCALVPDLGGFDLGIGQGNSVQCRLFHLGAAAAARDPHCRHAAGAPPCR